MRTLKQLLWIASVLALQACASGSSTDRHAQPQNPPEPSAITDGSYDWHVLVLVPFGVLLKDSPLPLHEVLVFHDETNHAESEDKDCYSIEGAPPRFMGQAPDHYLLCFEHDHLNRVDVAVRLPAADAPQVFARACALWLKSTAATMASGTTCEGRDGSVAFSARLASLPGESAAAVTMTLTDAALREAAHDAPSGE